MHVPTRLGEQRGNMAVRALPCSVEDLLSALGGFLVEVSLWRLWRGIASW